MKIAVSKDPEPLKINKEDTPNWRRLNGSFENKDLSLSELIDYIEKQHAITTQHHTYRHSDYFISAQHLGLDFDTDDIRSTIEFLLKDEFIRDNASFIYTTWSHTEQAPRARVVFILDREITDKDKYALLAQALVKKFKLSDGSCHDPARFFYGAGENGTIHVLGNVLSLETCIPFVTEWKKFLADKEADRLERIKNTVVVSSDEVSPKLLQSHSDSLLSRVMNAGVGEKYITLRDISATFGGYIAAGYYNYEDVVAWLGSAIRQNGNGTAVNGVADDKTIEKSISYGMNRPLYFDAKSGSVRPETVEDAVSELDTVIPPLTPSQKVQVSEIILSLQETFVEARQQSDIDFGFESMILDHLNIGLRTASINEETGEMTNEAMTVPYYNINGEVMSIEFRSDSGITYDNEVGLYTVKPMLPETNSYGIILPDSLTAIHTYLEGDGNANVYGLPQTKLEVELPDMQLYCAFTEDYDEEILDILNRFGVKFSQIVNIEKMIKSLGRSNFERMLTRGRPLNSVL